MKPSAYRGFGLGQIKEPSIEVSRMLVQEVSALNICLRYLSAQAASFC